MTIKAADREGRRPTLSVRLTPAGRATLERSASANGRSLAAEVECRLEASFHDDDAMRVIRETIRQEMRAEFAARSQYMPNAYVKAGYQQAFCQGYNGDHGQQYLQARNQFHGNYMALKTEPEKA